eukprot:CFRG7685T1
MSPNAKLEYTHHCDGVHENGFEAYPSKDGLYDPVNEKDSCGVGFVTNIDGTCTHANVKDALVILERMFHRGACGCEENTGDGAGILTGMPHEFMVDVASKIGVQLPEVGKYVAGNIFLSQKSEELKEECRSVFESTASELGLEVQGWRVIPVDNSMVGPSALATEPITEQVYITAKDKSLKGLEIDRLAYTLRKRLEKSLPKAEKSFYICSLSTGTIVYKGQLSAYQVGPYYIELSDPNFKSHMALIHSRFSTNTFPSWSRAQPFRLLGHNGEINTLRGNKNWMRAREGMLKSDMFGDLTESLYPIIEAAGSDSAAFDNVLEFLVMDGRRSLPEVMMLMVPEAWQNDVNMTPKKRAFYEYCSFVMEAWDGPALFTFTDGRYIGATLDRNGLRPARYYITDDNRMVMASEVGVLDVPIGNIVSKGRLQPGKMLLVDTLENIIVDDDQLKSDVANKHNYAKWLESESVNITKIANESTSIEHSVSVSKGVLFDRRLPAFGWSLEHINMLVKPMVELRKEALGSMGNDAPLAVLSKKPRLIHEYFKQLFAQVTNPPIDPFRESIIMSLRQVIGPEFNVLEKTAEQCRRLVIENPILSTKELNVVRDIQNKNKAWKVAEIDTTFLRSTGAEGMMDALERISDESFDAIMNGYKVIVLSDKAVCRDRVPIPSALAVGAVHQYLVREKKRLNVAIVLETGEVNVVHQICVLLGFGVDAICPYLVFETMATMRSDNMLDASYTDDKIAKNYQAAVNYGMRKVMAKMGISTLMSYKGAQIFEAVGLAEDVIDRCFTNCASRIKGVGFSILAQEAFSRHDIAFPLEREDIPEARLIENPGDFHWRDGGEDHMNHPNVISSIQDAARRNNKSSYEKYVRESDKQIKNCTLRGLLEFNVKEEDKISIDEVIPAEDIVKRFCTGAMSYGSISMEAHSTLAVAMNRIGGKSNTGEGGENPTRFSPMGNGDSMRSAIKQVASGRFGVSAWYLTNADEIQIKMAQGAKPGEGGELPGFKVSQSIADCRNSTPGVGLISPPPHHDIYSIEDLKQLIYDLKCANPSARISVKLVSEVGVGVVAAGVAKGFADHILISGHDGGTGASSWTGIKYAGLPWELGLSETHQTLVQNDLRGRVIVQADGQIRHGRDVAIAALLGAEEFGFATVPLIVMGCTMMRKCHLNTCPVGVATQDPELRKKFTGMPEHVVNYFFMVAEHCREIMASLGLRTIEDMVGRTDKLKMDTSSHGFKAKTVDLTPVLKLATQLRPNTATFNTTKQAHALAERKDNVLIERFSESLKKKIAMSYDVEINNLDRAFATTLSHEIMKAQGKDGLPTDTITLNLTGSAGQSLGAFLAPGITINLKGDSNDYVGKGMMGGRIVVAPDNYHSSFIAEDNVIAGNVCLYGATGGEAYFRGILAERFCVRNSGATAVCEGVGDHGCEYMTGGYAVILGKTGRNFAAGMSGGIAYVLDEANRFKSMVNAELVSLDECESEEDKTWLRTTLENHFKYTGSAVAKRLLGDFENSVKKFIKVFPHDYKAALEAKKVAEAAPPVIAATEAKVEEVKDLGTEDIEDFIVDNESEEKKKLRWRKLDKLKGFSKYKRQPDGYRNAEKRIGDFAEIRVGLKEAELNRQGARCMDCGVPFCQSDTGCPLGNVIPQWNDLVYRNRWQEALDRLMLTNNFPEFTGRVCPAPCEGACVLGINEPAVAIKSIECAIIDRGFEMGWIKPNPPKNRTGKNVAIVGGGPAGMAAADQLNKMGHSVTVYERNDRVGGLLMYGIPNMKLEKRIVQRRVDLLAAEGITFKTGCDIGKGVDARELYDNADAMLLTVGATWPRDLPISGRDLNGVHFAMDFLTPTTKKLLDENKTSTDLDWTISAKGKKVVVIGGGDTGNDCIGTSVRMGATSVTNFEILPPPPPSRADENPWPTWPRIFRVDYGHSEVQAKYARDPRVFNIMAKEFIGEDGNLKGVKTVQVEWVKDDKGAWKMSEVPDSEEVYEADLVFIAMGFLGPEATLKEALNADTDARSNIKTPAGRYSTSVEKLYAAGDCRRGQSLIVWAISEGRQAARQIDLDLTGWTTLPLPGGVIPKRQEVTTSPPAVGR